MSVPRLHRAQPTGRTLPILAATYSGCGRNTAPVSAVLANMSRRTDTVSSEGQGSKPTESGFVAISVPNTHWCALISCRLLVGESPIVVTARRPGTSVFWAVPHTQTRACPGLAHKASQLSESNGQSNTITGVESRKVIPLYCLEKSCHPIGVMSVTCRLRLPFQPVRERGWLKHAGRETGRCALTLSHKVGNTWDIPRPSCW